MHAFPLVSVSGTAYEMGFQHGQQAGDLIRKYLLWIEKSTGRGRIDVEVMKEILADHQGDPGGICRHGANGSYSITGYLAEPAEGLFHVRRGHGCTGTWARYEV
ncbi:MAG: hypothetical protein HYW07_14555 [Candidatus Latescibacteria bacterium]|nr:hypothetical protein [Candidatus Latescibacterota bacterium]